jgi:hypothetical protein
MTETQDEAWRFDGLNALFINCTLKRSPELSHTQGLIDRSRAIMERHVLVDAGGMPAHGNQRSEWDAGCRFDFENPDYR